MQPDQVEITMPVGACAAYMFCPPSAGPWPAVLFLMDGFGIRPALFEMAERLAQGGYVVLLPNLYYRAGAHDALVPKEVFAAGNVQAQLGPLIASTDNRRGAEDAGSFLDFLDTRVEVKQGGIAVVGYCRTGALALTVAATYPDRITAVASFHGGNLATDADDSPHLLASEIRARVYVAGADQDASYPPEMAARLGTALTEANVDHHCEIYEGARHGWAMPDFPVYDADASERHWHALFALLDATLKH